MRNIDYGLTGLLSASDRKICFDSLAGHGALQLVWRPVGTVGYVPLGYWQFSAFLVIKYGVSGHTEYLCDLIGEKALLLKEAVPFRN